jgi:GNAT superfamily N-acetyltransferase
VHTIHELDEGHWEQWLPLWKGYLEFYRAELPEETTRGTFARLVGGDRTMFGLLAVSERGEGVGLTHCIVHPTTWSDEPKCYLEDLFVAPAARGSNLGQDLLKEAKRESVQRAAGPLYWHTQSYNGRARSLYDLVARPTSFIVYEM